MKTHTFGCRLNTFETAAIEKLAGDALNDVYLINTCAVTAEAERQVRQTIRKIKRENPDMRVWVVGCAAQLHPEEYARMPEVDRVLGNHEKLSKQALLSSEKVLAGDLRELPVDLPIVSDFDGKTKAFLQIQQGCDHACTFCIVTKIRGHNSGLSPELVVEQAKTFVQNGYEELILTGVDVTSYPYGFCDIIRKLLAEVKGLKRLRFGSLDPAALDDEFVELMHAEPRLMPHVHLSIQAGDDLVLKRMGRRHLREHVIRLCKQLHAVRPNMVIGADFITGFPTETEEQFQNTLDLVNQAGIDLLHVFPYSVRPGTPAAKMPQVPVPMRKERASKLRALGEIRYAQKLDSFIGQTLSVLVEHDNQGFSENYLKVQIENTVPTGSILSVHITKRNENGLVGHI